MVARLAPAVMPVTEVDLSGGLKCRIVPGSRVRHSRMRSAYAPPRLSIPPTAMWPLRRRRGPTTLSERESFARSMKTRFLR